MRIFKKIVVGMAFSGPAFAALRQAHFIADKEEALLIAYHIVTPAKLDYYQGNDTVPTDEVLQDYRDRIAEIAERELGKEAEIDIQVAVGLPFDSLSRKVSEVGADLLVIGSQSEIIDQNETGPFATKIVRHSDTAVLLARKRHLQPFKRIVACVDFGTSTQEVIETAAKIAVDEGGQLTVVHAVCPPWMSVNPLEYGGGTPDFRLQYEELLRSELEAAVRGASQFLPLEVRRETVLGQRPGPELMKFLCDEKADLVVIGRNHHSRLGQAVLGSMAERIIHHSPCSVLTVVQVGEEGDSV